VFSIRTPGVHDLQTVAAIDPGIRRRSDFDEFLRGTTRVTVLVAYLAAVIVAFVLVRPAFHDEGAPVVPTPEHATTAIDRLQKGESVATFAARHGLDLGELLALNPKVDSLRLPPGTKLRVG
jgi:LysM domain